MAIAPFFFSNNFYQRISVPSVLICPFQITTIIFIHYPSFNLNWRRARNVAALVGVRLPPRTIKSVANDCAAGGTQSGI